MSLPGIEGLKSIASRVDTAITQMYEAPYLQLWEEEKARMAPKIQAYHEEIQARRARILDRVSGRLDPVMRRSTPAFTGYGLKPQEEIVFPEPRDLQSGIIDHLLGQNPNEEGKVAPFLFDVPVIDPVRIPRDGITAMLYSLPKNSQEHGVGLMINFGETDLDKMPQFGHMPLLSLCNADGRDPSLAWASLDGNTYRFNFNEVRPGSNFFFDTPMGSVGHIPH